MLRRLRLALSLALALALLLNNQIPLLVARKARPPRLEPLFARVEAREGVGFGVEHDFVEREYVVGAEEEVHVFQRFGLGRVG